jgi:hypothetical protein
VAANGGALLEGEQLLGAERFVVDLGRGLDQVLQVGAGEKVAQVDEFAVVLVLDCVQLAPVCLAMRMVRTIDNTPAVLATANLLAIDHDGLF